MNVLRYYGIDGGFLEVLESPGAHATYSTPMPFRALAPARPTMLLRTPSPAQQVVPEIHPTEEGVVGVQGIEATPTVNPVAAMHVAASPPCRMVHQLASAYELPSTIPLSTFEDVMLSSRHYGMSSIKPSSVRDRMAAELQVELHPFHAWCTQAINLERPVGMNVVAEATWRGMVGQINGFLGFAYNCHQVNKCSLMTYLDANIFMSFVSYLRLRDVDKDGIARHAQVGARVIKYLLKRVFIAPREAGMAMRAQATLDWYMNLSNQLSKNLVPKPRIRDPTVLEEAGRWVSPEDLTRCAKDVREIVLETLGLLDEGQVTKSEAAVKLCGGVLTSPFWGYVPPLRPSCVITTTMPNYEGPCLHESCSRPMHCVGNRFQIKVEQGPDGSESQSVWWVITHHKNSVRYHGEQLVFKVPKDMQAFLDPWFGWAHAELTADEPTPYAFLRVVDTEEGRAVPVTPKTISDAFNSVMFESMEGLHVAVQRMRSIFVEAIQSGETGMPGGDAFMEASTVVMTNSVNMWRRYYDRRYRLRSARDAIDKLSEWRANGWRVEEDGDDPCDEASDQGEIPPVVPREGPHAPSNEDGDDGPRAFSSRRRAHFIISSDKSSSEDEGDHDGSAGGLGGCVGATHSTGQGDAPGLPNSERGHDVVHVTPHVMPNHGSTPCLAFHGASSYLPCNTPLPMPHVAAMDVEHSGDARPPPLPRASAAIHMAIGGSLTRQPQSMGMARGCVQGGCMPAPLVDAWEHRGPSMSASRQLKLHSVLLKKRVKNEAALIQRLQRQKEELEGSQAMSEEVSLAEDRLLQLQDTRARIQCDLTRLAQEATSTAAQHSVRMQEIKKKEQEMQEQIRQLQQDRWRAESTATALQRQQRNEQAVGSSVLHDLGRQIQRVALSRLLQNLRSGSMSNNGTAPANSVGVTGAMQPNGPTEGHQQQGASTSRG